MPEVVEIDPGRPVSPHRAGLAPRGEGELEVAALHPHRLGGLGRRHGALDGRDPRRPAEGRQLGAGPAGGPGGQLREAARGVGEAGRGVAVEDRQPPAAIRDRDGDVGIEAPRPPDGRVNGRQPVGRRQHNDLPPCVQAVEQHAGQAKEFAIRVALGADRRRVMMSILGWGVSMTAVVYQFVESRSHRPRHEEMDTVLARLDEYPLGGPT